MVDALPEAELDVHALDDLLAVLERIQAGHNSPEDQRDLENGLEDGAYVLEALLALPGPDAAKRAEMEKARGTVYSPQHLAEIGALSDYLHVSESIAQTLLQDGRREGPRLAREPFAAAVIIHHRARLDALRCIMLMWEVAFVEQPDEATERVRNYLREWEAAVCSAPGPSSSKLTTVLLDAVDRLSSEIDESLPGPARLALVPSLPEAVKQSRVRSLRKEQRMLLRILHGRTLGDDRAGAGEIFRLVLWMKQRPAMGSLSRMAYAVFVSALLPDDIVHSRTKSETDYLAHIVRTSGAEIQAIHGQIISHDQWRSQPLCRIVQLQWFIFVDILTQVATRHRDIQPVWDVLGNRRNCEAMYEAAISADAFQSLQAYVEAFPTVKNGDYVWQAPEGADVPLELRDEWPHVESEFVTEALEQVARSFQNVVAAQIPLRRTILREEDEDKAYGRDADADLRHDFAAFVQALVALYARRPADLDMHVWEDERFLQQAAGYAVHFDKKALFYDLLQAAGRGPQSSRRLLQFLSGRNKDFSFADIFEMLAFLQNETQPLTIPPVDPYQINSRPVSKPVNSEQSLALSPDDLELIVKVCQCTEAIASNGADMAQQLLQAKMKSGADLLDLLLDLVNRSLSSQATAAVLLALSAIGNAQWASVNFAAARRILAHLGQIEVAPAKSRQTNPSTVLYNRPGGWLKALEDADNADSSAAAAIAFVKLATCVLSAQEAWIAQHLAGGHVYASGSRNPVSGHLLQYVLDDAAAKSKALTRNGFIAEAADLSHAIFECVLTCLEAYDLRAMARSCGSAQVSLNRPAAGHLANAVEQPGAEILRKALGEADTFDLLLNAAAIGASSLRKAQSPRTTRMAETALRTVNVVLAKQSLFVGPLQESFVRPDAPQAVKAFALRTSVHSLDEHLAGRSDLVVQLASYVASDMDDLLAFLSLRILRHLMLSPFFSRNYTAAGTRTNGDRLTHFVQSSSESLVITAGISERLNVEATPPADAMRSEALAETVLTSRAQHAIEANDLRWLLRSAILDLLIDGTVSVNSGPTFAHYLLGYSADGDRFRGRLMSNSPDGESGGCVHEIVQHLTLGVPRIEEATNQASDGEEALVSFDPYLANKMTQVLHQVAQDPLTCGMTLKFLRTEHDFINRTLRSMQTAVSAVSADPLGSVAYADGLELATTPSDLTSTFKHHANLLHLAALALHADAASSKDVSQIVRAVLESSRTEEGALYGNAQEAALALEIFYRSRCQWSDARAVSGQPQFYNSIDWEALKGLDTDGVLIYDMEAVNGAMLAEEAAKVAASSLSVDEIALMRRDRALISQAIAIQNDRALIAHAAGQLLDAWIQLIDVILLEQNSVIPTSRRQSLLFDLCRAVIYRLLDDGEVDGTARQAVLLARVTLTIVSTLVEAIAAQEASGQALPAEQLLDLGEQLLSAVARQREQLARGYLQAACIELFQVISKAVERGVSPNAGKVRDLLVHLMQGEHCEPMFATVCSDAFGGYEVWKAVSYTFLNCSIHLFRGSDEHTLLQRLSRTGFLNNVIRSIASADADIRSALTPEADALDPVYALEAKLSLLQVIAQSRAGADRLVREGVFEALSQCHYIDAHPDVLEAAAEFDLGGYMPTPLERYLQVLLPTLRLSAAILGNGDVVAAKKAQQFLLLPHRETLMTLLRTRTLPLSLAMVEVLQLVVVMLCRTLSLQAKHVKTSDPELEGLQVAAEGLAARSLDPEWRQRISPLSQEEIALERVDNGAAFRRRANAAVASLCDWQLALGVAKTGSKGTAAMHPAFASSDASNSRWRQNGSVNLPTLHQATQLLSDSVEDLYAGVFAFDDVTAKLQDEARLGPSDIDELLAARGVPSAGPTVRIALAQAELRVLQTDARANAVECLATIERLLLLLDRHIDYYKAYRPVTKASMGYIDAGNAQGPTQEQVDCEDVLAQLVSPLSKLQELDLVCDALDNDETSSRLVASLSRKLLRAAGVQ